MEHSYFKDRISAFHDNELKNEERQLMAEHLEGCAECGQLLEELRRFDAMVEKHSGLSEGEYWEKAAQKIEAAIGTEEKTEIIEVKRTSYWGLGWKLAGAAASVAIIAFIALYEGDIKKEVDKRSKAAVEEQIDERGQDAVEQPAPAGDIVLDSAAGAVADLGGPTPVREEAAGLGAAEDRVEKEVREPSVVTNEKGEVFVRGGRGAETAYIVPDASELQTEEKLERAPSEGTPVDSSEEATPHLSQIELYQSIPPMTRKDSEQAPDYESDAMMEYSLEDAEEETGLSLQQWRAKRDSVQELLTDQKRRGARQAISALEAPPALKEDKRKLAAFVDSISKELEKKDPALVLLECHYQIARLTESEEEREGAIAYLRGYLEDEDSEYKLQAAFYLQQLNDQ